ncbi:MAG TPA: dockerin type I domain-containing protein, partial [Candidatus Hydrogenedentes bacterium]|nr:dockerin type I domain-containing protein [Candidatus Hydrogenedentota bacterium]
YAADALGKAELTIRATDQDGLYVDTAFRVTLHTVNTPPTTTGIANVSVKETAPNTVIALFPVFGDAETADNALVLSVAGNTNPALFDAVTIGAATGALTLDYAAGAFGAAQITIRATDEEGLYVESAFTVTVAEVTSDVNNDGVINAVDVQLVINAALGLPVEGEPDINGDNDVNAVDVQLVINGVLGI